MTSHVPTETLKLLTKFEQDAIIDLYEVDLSEITGTQTIYRFFNGLNQIKQPLVWQGNIYDPNPIKVEGFEWNGQGTSNRPTLSISDENGRITGLAHKYNDLLGAIVKRQQVYAKFLDSVNFEGGNAEADPTQEVVSYYVVERLTTLVPTESATFELALPIESDGALLPARIILAHTCCWQYRSTECGYTGGAVADEFDNPTDKIEKDCCSHTLNGCRLRYGRNSALPYGGCPAAAKIS